MFENVIIQFLDGSSGLSDRLTNGLVESLQTYYYFEERLIGTCKPSDRSAYLLTNFRLVVNSGVELSQ